MNMQIEQHDPLSDLVDDEFQQNASMQLNRQLLNKEHKVKESYQFRALLRKMATLQWKQKGTNCCQICTPLLSLSFILLIKALFHLYVPKRVTSLLSVPYPINLPEITDTLLDRSTCLEWFLYDFNGTESEINNMKDYVGYLDRWGNKSGMLGDLSQLNCASKDFGNIPVPYFQLPKANQSINKQIFDGLTYLNKQNFTAFKDIKNNHVLPDGAITFKKASDIDLSIRLQINDVYMKEYHRNNGFTKMQPKQKYAQMFGMSGKHKNYKKLTVTEGALSLLDLVTKSYMRQIDDQTTVISAVQNMPFIFNGNTQIMKLLNVMGATLFPLALSMLLPVFMYSIVQEKEDKLIQIMKMNGMQMWRYWVANFIFDFFFYFCMVVIYFLYGYYILKISYFTQSSFIVQFITYGGWGVGQIGMGFFWSSFIKKSKSASILGYILAIFIIFMAAMLNSMVWADINTGKYPPIFNAYPTFAFARVIYNMTKVCSQGSCYSSFSQVDSETMQSIISLYIYGIIYILLGTYLNEIIKQEFGVKKKCCYFLNWCKGKRKVTEINKDQDSYLRPENEDDDCVEERRRVHNLKDASGIPLVINNLRQVYPAQGDDEENVAVKSFNLMVQKGETFGLLGPNGAGKTTIISMLTGLYPPKAGNAWINNYDVVNNLPQVQRRIGVCPQFNILWDELTVEEHLYFYARLKGTSPQDEKQDVRKAISEVKLEDKTKERSKNLSGGMKRKLSIAIALVGAPEIIFLDEPCTGLDPKNKRNLWNVLTRKGFRENRALVVTTHSMEEADVLCDRIGS